MFSLKAACLLSATLTLASPSGWADEPNGYVGAPPIVPRIVDPQALRTDCFSLAPDVNLSPRETAWLNRDVWNWGKARIIYPQPSIVAREAGTVQLALIIDAVGAVQQIAVNRSSESALLDNAAASAYLGAKLSPFPDSFPADCVEAFVNIDFVIDTSR